MIVALGRTKNECRFYERTENNARYRSDVETIKAEAEPLSKEELKELFYLYKRDNNMDAFWKIIKSNLKYVIMYAKRYAGGSKVSYDDLVAEGNLALIDALKSYDYEKNNGEFRSWANFFLEKYLSKLKEGTIYPVKIPCKIKDKIKEDKNKEENEFFQRFSISDAIRSFSINDVYNDDKEEKSEYASYLTSEENADKSFDYELVKMCMDVLDEKERVIINYNYGMNDYPKHTEQEIADILGLSKNNVYYTRTKAIKKMRVKLLEIIKYDEQN